VQINGHRIAYLAINRVAGIVAEMFEIYFSMVFHWYGNSGIGIQ